MDTPTRHCESNRDAGRGASDIETAAAGIAEAISSRFADPDHPWHFCQVVWSAETQCIWVVTAEGPCLDERYTLLEIYPDKSLTSGSEGDDEPSKVGWRVSRPSEIVDLLRAI